MHSHRQAEPGHTRAARPLSLRKRSIPEAHHFWQCLAASGRCCHRRWMGVGLQSKPFGSLLRFSSVGIMVVH